MCGFPTLSREERIVRANEILSSTELKQHICHEILGCTHKDVEKIMTGVLKERQVTEAQQDLLDLEEMEPDKFDPEIQFAISKVISATPSKDIRYSTYSREQVAKLMAASGIKHTPLEERMVHNYDFMPRETAERLVREHYEYLEEQKKKRMEKDEWATKTIASDIKTSTTRKHSTSTKG